MRAEIIARYHEDYVKKLGADSFSRVRFSGSWLVRVHGKSGSTR